MDWRRSKLALTLSIILFPPAGLIHVWLRPGAWTRKALLTPLVVLWFCVYGFLILAAGVMSGTIEPAGGMDSVFFIARDAEAHFDELEQSRQQQQQSALNSSGDNNTFSEYWTGFRGPGRKGRYEQTPIMTDWPEDGLPLLWKQPIGGGYASFAIANGVAFTIEQRRDREVASAYDLLSGLELWTHSWEGRFHEPLGGEGPRATPSYHDGHVLVQGAEGDLWKLSADDGAVVWHVNIIEDAGASLMTYGVAASPLIVDGMVVVAPGGEDSSFVAYDIESGEAVWRSQSDRQEYVSPSVVELAGVRQILSYTDTRFVGMAIEDGSLLWEHPLKKQMMYESIAQPVVIGDNRVFQSGSYGYGCELIEVSNNDGEWSVESLWRNNRMKNKFSSSILHEGHLYGLNESVLACLDPESGERLWRGGRYGYGQIVYADGHIIVLTEFGELALVKATPEGHQELARFQALEGKTWNMPALSDGYLLVRNAFEMACFRIAPEDV